MFSKQMKIRDARALTFRLAALTAMSASAVAMAGNLLNVQCNTCVAARSRIGAAVAQLPWVGLGGALVLMVLSFCHGESAARLRMNLSLVGGGIGAGLLIVQGAVFHSFCPTCCLVDAAFVLAALVEANRARVSEPVIQS